MQETNRTVSVIVSTMGLKRLADLKETVNSLRNQACHSPQIVVVAEASHAEIEVLKQQLPSETKVVECQGLGLSAARNTGIQSSNGEIAAFIDDDAVADREWLSNLVDSYNDPKVVGVGGEVRPLWNSARPAWFPSEMDWVLGCTYTGFSGYTNAAVRNFHGCNMSFRHRIFEKCGMFREDVGRHGRTLAGAEETELCLRASRILTGSKLMFNQRAVVHHKVAKNRQRISYLVNRCFMEGVSKAQMSKMHKGALSDERSYAKSAVVDALRRRAKTGRVTASAAQLMVLWLGSAAVGLGFLYGNLKSFSGI